MSMIFKFRMLTDENDRFLREYEIPYDATLLDFHRFICRDLKYSDNEMASFFLSDERWQKLQEFTLTDMGEEGVTAPIPMENAVLREIIRQKNERLLYVFDLFEDRAFFLQLCDSKKQEPDTEYPQAVNSEGEAPDQFNMDMLPGERSVFEEAMDDFSGFEGSDDEDFDD